MDKMLIPTVTDISIRAERMSRMLLYEIFASLYARASHRLMRASRFVPCESFASPHASFPIRSMRGIRIALCELLDSCGVNGLDTSI